MEALRIMIDEHQSLAAILHAIRMMLRDIGSGTLQPDMGLLRAMVHYLDAYPEKRHHPKEDQFLFALLRQRTAEGAEALDRLEAEHARGNDRIKALEAAVQRYRAVREACLVDSLDPQMNPELGELARLLRTMSGLYDQAARAATSL